MKNLLIATIFILSACTQGGSGDNSITPTDPIYGDWYYQAPGSSSTQAKGIIAHIDANGLQFASAYAYINGGSATYYVRKNIGTYVRNGEAFAVTYSYETCDPVHQETLYIKVSGDKLVVSTADRAATFILSRANIGDSSIQTAAMIEDKNCNILAKIEKTQSRIPASAKSKSFLERVIK